MLPPSGLTPVADSGLTGARRASRNHQQGNDPRAGVLVTNLAEANAAGIEAPTIVAIGKSFVCACSSTGSAQTGAATRRREFCQSRDCGIGFAHGSTVREAGRPFVSGHLRVLLADCAGGRARLLETRLREIGDVVILRAAAGVRLTEAVAAGAPDVIIVDMARPDRDALDDLRRAGADNPRPVIMFVDRDDRAFMEEAIAAGVSSYNVVDSAFPDVRPIVMAAVAIFRRYRQVAADLQEARTRLMEREAIDRAKALLMRRRHLDESQAYRWLRRKAMSESKRIAVVAAELLAAETPGSAPN